MNDLHARLRVQLISVLEELVGRSELPDQTVRAFQAVFNELRKHDGHVVAKRDAIPVGYLRTLLRDIGDCSSILDRIDSLQRAATADAIFVEPGKVIISLVPERMAKLGRALAAMATGKSMACAHHVVGDGVTAEFSLVDYHDYAAKREAGAIDMAKGLARALYNLLWRLRDIADERHDTSLRSHCVAALDHLARSSRHDEQRPCYDHRSLAAAVFAATYAAGLNGGAASCGHAILAVVEACRAFDPPEPPLPENVALAQTGT